MVHPQQPLQHSTAPTPPIQPLPTDHRVAAPPPPADSLEPLLHVSPPAARHGNPRRPYAPLRQYQNVIAGTVAAPRFDGLYKQMRAPLIAERPSARTVMMAKRERERLLGTTPVKIAVPGHG